MKNRNKKIEEELAALARMRDEDIDTSDIPEVRDWSGAVVGKFYRPIKEAVSLRLDADVLAWFKSQGPGYQTRINELLRTSMSTSRLGQNPTGRIGCKSLPNYEPQEDGCAFRYPGLERHGELQKCDRMATLIVDRKSLFAAAG